MLDAFKDAANTFITVIERELDRMIREQYQTILDIRNALVRAKEKRRVVHTVGMGRSGLAGRFFADLLKLHGVQASVIGDTLARPVGRGDVVVAFSGSGWTNTTTLYAEMCIRRGALLIAFTATPKSKLDRLADITLYLPGKPILDSMDYIVRKIIGKYKSPLAPMGSITEFSALVFGAGIASTMMTKNPIEDFRLTVNTIIDVCKNSLQKVLSDITNLRRFIEEYVEAKNLNKTCFFSGLGLLEHISQMIAIRFQHLGLNVGNVSDWVLRRTGDVLTVISGSGEAPIPRILAEEAKKSGMRILAVIGNEQSTIARLSDIYLILEDIEERRRYFTLGREEFQGFVPAFEIASLMIFEAIVAELANRFGLTEEVMRIRHANIE